MYKSPGFAFVLNKIFFDTSSGTLAIALQTKKVSIWETFSEKSKRKNENLEKNLRSLKMETFVSKNEDFMGYSEIEP